MKRRDKKLVYQLTLKEKLNLGITLAVLVLFGSVFFYINAVAIFELLHINPQLLTDTIIFSTSTMLISIGIWLILPIKIRISIEAFFYSLGRSKNKFLLMNDSQTYQTVLSTKLASSFLIRIIGISLICCGLIVYFFFSA